MDRVLAPLRMGTGIGLLGPPRLSVDKHRTPAKVPRAVRAEAWVTGPPGGRRLGPCTHFHRRYHLPGHTWGPGTHLGWAALPWAKLHRGCRVYAIRRGAAGTGVNCEGGSRAEEEQQPPSPPSPRGYKPQARGPEQRLPAAASRPRPRLRLGPAHLASGTVAVSGETEVGRELSGRKPAWEAAGGEARSRGRALPLGSGAARVGGAQGWQMGKLRPGPARAPYPLRWSRCTERDQPWSPCCWPCSRAWGRWSTPTPPSPRPQAATPRQRS